MEWQVIVALILAIILCFLPVGMAWHFYSGNPVQLSRKSKDIRHVEKPGKS